MVAALSLSGASKLVARLGVIAVVGGAAAVGATVVDQHVSRPTVAAAAPASSAAHEAAHARVELVAAKTALVGAARPATSTQPQHSGLSSGAEQHAAASIGAAVAEAQKAYTQAAADLKQAESALHVAGPGGSAGLQKTVAGLAAQAKQVAAVIAEVQKLVETAGSSIAGDIDAAVKDLGPAVGAGVAGGGGGGLSGLLHIWPASSSTGGSPADGGVSGPAVGSGSPAN